MLLSDDLLAQPHFKIIDLGIPYSVGYGINDSAEVAGEYFTLTGDALGFRWKDGTMTSLGTLSGYPKSHAQAINNSGRVVGWGYDASNASDHAFVWQNNSMSDIDSATVYAHANAINDSGHVVGIRSVMVGNESQAHAYLWNNGTGTDLMTLTGYSSSATAINNSTQIVGSYSAFLGDGSFTHAFLWHDGTMTDLGPPNPSFSIAFGINNSGQVVGWMTKMPSVPYHAFVWQAGDSIRDLGTLGGQTSIAHAINDAGQIVGQSQLPGNNQSHAVLWRDGGMYDLNNLADTSGGWLLIDAYDINNSGQITGIGRHNLQTRAFLLKHASLWVVNPAPGSRVVVDQADTIRWLRDVPRNVEIRFTVDGGANYTLLTTVPSTESTYVWHPPTTFSTSTNCFVKLTDALDANVSVTSGRFTMRGYDLVRPIAGGGLEAFSPDHHGWFFANAGDVMWTQAWYNQFDYPHIPDKFTGSPYSADFLFTPQKPVASDFPDWPLFVETFGTDKCYTTTLLGDLNPPRESAVEAWKSIKGEWHGACFGFPTSALLHFTYHSEFIAQNQNIPSGSELYSVLTTGSSIQTVNKYFLYQSDRDQIAHADASRFSVTPRDLLEDLKAMLLEDNGDPKTLSMLNTSNPRAHTLIPFRLVRDEFDARNWRIMVYDCNSPGQIDQYILLDSLANTWEEFLGLGYDIGNDGLFLNLPISHFLQRPVLSLLETSSSNVPNATAPQATGETWIYVSDTSSVSIVSPAGDTLGFANGKVMQDIRGATAMISSVAVQSPPYGYYLPDSAYAINVSSFADSEYSLLMKDEGAVYKYLRTGIQSPGSDLLSIDHGMTATNSEVEMKTIHLTAIIPGDETEAMVGINDISMPQGGSIHIERSAPNSITLLNAGSSVTYNLRAQWLGPEGLIVYSKKNVALSSTSSQLIHVGHDSGGVVTIFVDEGNNGSVEDSIIIYPQVTSLQLQPSWNMLSIPQHLPDYRKSLLFPSASSNAFAYTQSGYAARDTLRTGEGYWVKFDSAQQILLLGATAASDTLALAIGWNMIGSISTPVPVSNVSSIPGGIVTSSFFGYGISYTAADTITPGRAYWVKVNQAGKLILSATAATPLTRIRIVPTAELPPVRINSERR